MGKYWELEEITAEEATAIIGKREEEMAPKEETQESEKRPKWERFFGDASSPCRQIPRANPATAFSARAAA